MKKGNNKIKITSKDIYELFETIVLPSNDGDGIPITEFLSLKQMLEKQGNCDYFLNRLAIIYADTLNKKKIN